MSRNLFDFGDEKLPDEENLKQKLKESDIDAEDVKKNYEKYKDFSRDDLAKEFISLAKQQKGEGKLNNGTIYEIVDKLSPYMDSSQKEFLHNLIKKTDE